MKNTFKSQKTKDDTILEKSNNIVNLNTQNKT